MSLGGQSVVKWDTPIKDGKYNLTIKDLKGRVIFNQEVNGTSQKVNLPKFKKVQVAVSPIKIARYN